MEDKNRNLSTTIIVALTSIMLIALGVVMLLMKTTFFGPFCKFLSVVIVVAGLYNMLAYFLKEQYKNTGNYGFVIGAAVLALGAIAFINSGSLVAVFPLILGYIILVLGLLMVQHTIDMKLLQKGPWVLSLVFAVILFVCGVLVIVNPDSFIDDNFYPFCVILICSGSFTLLSTICYVIAVIRYKREYKKNLDRNLEEDIDETVGDNSTIVDNTDTDILEKKEDLTEAE